MVVNGDIHQQNADRVGCSRRDVKTLTYAFIYGAGDQKLGHSLHPELKGMHRRNSLVKSYVANSLTLSQVWSHLSMPSKRKFVVAVVLGALMGGLSSAVLNMPHLITFCNPPELSLVSGGWWSARSCSMELG